MRHQAVTTCLCQLLLLSVGSAAAADVLDALGNLLPRRSQTPLPQIVEVIAQDEHGIGRGSGTLVYVDAEYGYILTNWHVVAKSEQTDINFPDGFSSPGTTVRTDENWDLALVRIWRPPAAPLLVASIVPQPGDLLTIAGYGQGTFRAARGKCIHYAAPDTKLPFEMVEVSVEARQGDSGGPILNERGELAGVLFGAGGGATTGSHIGRIKTFLDETFIEQQRLAHGRPPTATAATTSPFPPAFVPPNVQERDEPPAMDASERLVAVPPRQERGEQPSLNEPFELPPANAPVAQLGASPASADPASQLEPSIELSPVATRSPILADSIIPPPTIERPAIDSTNMSPRVAAQQRSAGERGSAGERAALPALHVPGKTQGRSNGLYGTRGFTLNRSLAERLWEATKSVLAVVGAIAIIFQFAKASVRSKD